MKISLIICAYNEEKYIEACLKHVLENSNNKFHEIIVVDNNSTDKTKEVALKFPRVTVVHKLEKGPNHARQKGIEVATGDILAFIDADTHMPKGWLDKALHEFKKNPHIGAISGPYIYYDFSSWERFLCFVYWYALAYPAYLILGYMVVGGNFIIRKEILEKINGFDTAIAFYGDDTDIARRASKHAKVKFKLNLPMYSSARRLKGEGIFKIAYIYVLNFISQVFTKKSATKLYKDIR